MHQCPPAQIVEKAPKNDGWSREQIDILHRPSTLINGLFDSEHELRKIFFLALTFSLRGKQCTKDSEKIQVEKCRLYYMNAIIHSYCIIKKIICDWVRRKRLLNNIETEWSVIEHFNETRAHNWRYSQLKTRSTVTSRVECAEGDWIV